MASAKNGPPDLGPEMRMPVTAYTDAARFDAELQHFHRSAFNLVAHASDVPNPGDYLTLELAGVPVVVVRGVDDGKVRAFINVCKHRGARVTLEEKGHCKRLVCPYHAWTYHTDGRLSHVRHAQGFPSLASEEISLTALACVEHASFIFVCPDPGARPILDTSLMALVDELEALNPGMVVFARQTHILQANWKLLVEGGIESYHFKIAHSSTIAKFFADTASTYEKVGKHMRSVLPRASIACLDADEPEQRRLLPHANILYTLNPNASVLAQDGHYGLILMSPLAIDRTRIDLITMGRPVPEGIEGAKVRDFLQTNHRFTVKTLEEDFVMAEQIQAGLASGANEYLRFATFEAALRDWHGILSEALGA
ncbi:MAG: Rieske 2Fe-2S domain-containing protein [Myxococcota bacterium]